MKLLVTGGGGFFGARILLDALSRNYRTLAVGRSPLPARLQALGRRGDFDYAVVDVASPGSLLSAAKRFRPDAIVHAAAPGVLRRSASGAHDTIVASVAAGVEVAGAAAELGTAVVWIGSAFEYARSALPVGEAAPMEPESMYAMAKNLSWRTFVHLAKVPHLTLRPFQLYGPGEDSERFVPSAILAVRGRAPNRFGDAETTRDFVFVDDAAAAVLSAADRLLAGHVAGAVLNISTGKGTSLREVASMIADVLTVPDFRFAFATPASTPSNPGLLIGQCNAAARVLGWRASTSLRDGLRVTCDSFR